MSRSGFRSLKSLNIRVVTLLLASTVVAVTAGRAQFVNDGATTTLSDVTNSFPSDVTVGTNGSFTLLVLSNNTLLTNSANGVISRNLTAKSNEVRLISSTARWRMAGSLFVGSNGANASLTVSNGAFVESGSGSFGFRLESSNNFALVTGAGSLWSNRSDLVVGSLGRANQLIVTNGGWVTDRYGRVGVDVTSSSNFVLVSGSSSIWSNVLDVTVGNLGPANRLVIEAGGKVLCAAGFVGSTASASNCEAVVTGPGSLWTNSDGLGIGSTPGFSRLIVSNGAAVRSTSGSLAAGSNNLVVTGPGSIWSNSTTLFLLSRADVTSGGWLACSDGYVICASNTVLLSGPSGWNNLGVLRVGDSVNAATLIASNGATILSSNALIGASTSLGNNNLVLLTGAGTVWSNRTDLTLGNVSLGNRMTLSKGAAMAIGGIGAIGLKSGGNSNSVFVSDAGTSWLIASNLYVGSNGMANSLVISNGGLAITAGSALGSGPSSSNNFALITGPGSTWSNQTTSAIFVGENGLGNRLTTSNGGHFYATTAYLGVYGTANNNEAIIAGTGSGWDLTGSLIVGFFGNGNRCVVSGGGRITNTTATIGTASSNNLVFVTGAGSSWSNLTLSVGFSGTGNQLVVSNQAVVAASDVLVGEETGGVNSRVIVDAGMLVAHKSLGNGTLDVRRGTNVFKSGLIDADELVLTNAQGFFEFNGGLLITHGATIDKGAPFVVGADGTTPANWDVRAGTIGTLLKGELYIGSNAPLCRLIHTNGAQLSMTGSPASVLMGWNLGANSNNATLSGPTSQWQVDGQIFVGNFASANRLVVSNGATLATGSSTSIGNQGTSSNNEVIVSGPGSTWTSQVGQLFIGGGRNNRLLISDGAHVTDYAAMLGNFFTDSSNNLAIVTGAGAVWTNATELRVGDAGPANKLVVSNSGTVFAGSAVYLGFASTSTNNRATVDGASLRVTNASATGTLDIRRGVFTLDSGLVEVDRLVATNALGDLKLNGGTLFTRSSALTNGVTIGNASSAATLFLVGNGTHTLNGAVVNGNGTLTGNGTINGIVATATGTISPGAPIGKIVLTTSPILSGSGTILMEISKNSGPLTNDQIQVTTSLTYDGILTVTNFGPTPLAAGDKIKLFSATAFFGAFDTINLPPLAPGLIWVNKLLVDGSLEVFAPPAILISSGSYTQSFDSLAMSGNNFWRDNSTLLGWYAAKTSLPNNITNYLASDGSIANGALYSFGSLGSSDRALGSIATVGMGDVSYGLCLTNDTANSVSNFTITYAGEQWRSSGGSGGKTLTFWYKTSASAITNPEPGVVTNWTEVTNLDFASPTVLPSATALDGNASSNRHVFSTVNIPGLTVAPGQNVFFRWLDIHAENHGMSLDDLIISSSDLPNERFWTNSLGGNYEVASNWFAHTLVGPKENANFTNDASYQVNWSADALAASAFFNAHTGTVTQAIGIAAWTVTNSYVVGRDTATTAAVTHVSGTLRVTNSAGDAQLIVGEAGRGTYTVSGGDIEADNLIVTNGSASRFTLSSGTLRTRNTRINQGISVDVGNFFLISSATLELLGNGSHVFANAMTVYPNGLLKGNGSITGNVFVAGTLSPGTSIGQISISQSLTFDVTATALFELNKAAGTNDSIIGLTNVYYAGTLIVTNLAGTLTNGDRFRLFASTHYAPSGFTNIVLPPLGPGLKWRNKLMMDGSLEVINIPTRDFGVDVSHFQAANGISQASWNQMFTEGKRFAFIKATEGLTGPHDAAMSNNVDRATAAGLLAGVYHFAHPENRPTTNGAILEASNFVVYAGNAIGPGRLRPVLDIENSATTLSTQALTDWVIAFSDEIIAQRGSNAAPIIYCTQNSANFEFDNRLANYDLWLRTIGGSDPAIDDPTNSLGFDPTGVFNEWSFWQYGDTGNSGGITPLDVDVCHSEYKTLTSYLIPGSPAPLPIQLGALALSGNGGFQFSFTNTPGAVFTVLAASNAALPLSNWTVLGAMTESPPGQFQFNDPQTTNNLQRYYRVRSP